MRKLFAVADRQRLDQQAPDTAMVVMPVSEADATGPADAKPRTASALASVASH